MARTLKEGNSFPSHFKNYNFREGRKASALGEIACDGKYMVWNMGINGDILLIHLIYFFNGLQAHDVEGHLVHVLQPV